MKLTTAFLLLLKNDMLFLLQEEYSPNFDSIGGDTIRHRWVLPYIRVNDNPVNFDVHRELVSTMARTTLGISVGKTSLKYLDTEMRLSCYVASTWEKNFPSPLKDGKGFFSLEEARAINLEDSTREVLKWLSF